MQKKRNEIQKQKMIKNYTNGDQNTTLLQLLYRKILQLFVINQWYLMVMRSWTNEINQKKSEVCNLPTIQRYSDEQIGIIYSWQNFFLANSCY